MREPQRRILPNKVSLAILGNASFIGLKDSEISGVTAQVSELALSQIGYQVTPSKIIFPKMYSRVHRGKVDVATPVFATPKRRGLAHYSTPVIGEYNVIMVLKGKVFKFETMSDLTGLRLAGRLGRHQVVACRNPRKERQTHCKRPA